MKAQNEKTCKEEKLRVINIGLAAFYDAVATQGAKAVQLDWRPPVEPDKDVADILDYLM